MKLPSKDQFEEWARQISRANTRAFDALFRAMYPGLVRFAYRYLKNRAAAQDIVQDCFVALWKTRHRLDQNRSLKSYLFTMVRNRALNELRDRSEMFVSHETSLYHQDAAEPDGTEGESADELESRMNQWIEQLPGRQKEAFQLSRYHGLDHEEIAEVMDVSPKTVNNHIVAALSTLRDHYEEYNSEVTNR